MEKHYTYCLELFSGSARKRYIGRIRLKTESLLTKKTFWNTYKKTLTKNNQNTPHALYLAKSNNYPVKCLILEASDSAVAAREVEEKWLKMSGAYKSPLYLNEGDDWEWEGRLGGLRGIIVD